MRDFFWFFALTIALWFGGEHYTTSMQVGIVERREVAPMADNVEQADPEFQLAGTLPQN